MNLDEVSIMTNQQASIHVMSFTKFMSVKDIFDLVKPITKTKMKLSTYEREFRKFNHLFIMEQMPSDSGALYNVYRKMHNMEW